MNDTNLEIEFQAHTEVLRQTLVQCAPTIREIIAYICECFSRGNKLLLCGNGGSAADAQHIAAEFVNRFTTERAALPAVALTTDTAILTSVGNDSCFENIFSRQIQAIAVKGDILAGISTSGQSANVLRALDIARVRGVTTIGFTGARGIDIMGPKCDHCVVIPSTNTARIQEAHEFVWHHICGMVENRLAAIA